MRRIAAGVAVLICATVVSAQELTLATVLARTASYVADYQHRLAAIVLE
jgi:hypothetical protein